MSVYFIFQGLVNKDEMLNSFFFFAFVISILSTLIFIFIYFFPFIFISWRLITLQYCSGFCHTLT